MPTILVVDDEEAIRKYIERVLVGRHYSVQTASSAQNAITACTERPFDVLLSDIVMPGPMDGLELAEIVARKWPAIEILLMTGYAGPGRTVSWPVLHKPFTPHVLLERIHHCLVG